ncbi:hypothetical protein AVEN_67681-1 [Araneus ventricosus]|uniref:Uncharacterized protein n=1 Tax=Araneus ventricosus TaxID=182803 RepID=A0A4Y2S6L5_ARAVE|nr:hypothetical protein AVEN_67681-1 [Araneus ventricosus]
MLMAEPESSDVSHDEILLSLPHSITYFQLTIDPTMAISTPITLKPVTVDFLMKRRRESGDQRLAKTDQIRTLHTMVEISY